MTFTTAVLILFTSLCISQMCNWSVIHGIKRKPHLSVVWNWYHFVAIAILHQPRPTVSADINTRLQLSDTSSIPPMHGGFLLIYMYCISYCLLWYHMHNMSRNWWFHFILSILIHRWNTKINCLNTIPSSVLLLIMMTSSNGKKSALLTLCLGNSLVTGEFPSRRPVTPNFGVFFDIRLNKRLSKHSWGWWFETPSHPLWRRCNEILVWICGFFATVYGGCLQDIVTFRTINRH